MITQHVRNTNPKCLSELLRSVNDDSDENEIHPSDIYTPFDSDLSSVTTQTNSNSDPVLTIPIGGDSPGRLPEIAGYEAIEILGFGGMGVVWKAVQLGTNREVAIKLMRPGRTENLSSLKLFRQEVGLVSKLEHPNIARIYDSGIHRLDYFFAMELIHGDDLLTYVKKNNLSQKQILQLIAKVCHAIAFAHQNGVIHGDLKPSNILVTPDGEPHVLDFGLATTRDNPLSRSGPAGTIAYMAPEQINGWTLPQTDVYGIGVILYEALAGRLPRNLPSSRIGALDAVSKSLVASPRNFNKSISNELQKLVLKSLTPDPEHRYRSCEDLASDIALFLDCRPISACSYSTFGYMKKHVRRHRRKVLAGMVTAGILVTIAAGMTSRISQVEAEAYSTSVSKYSQQINLAEAAMQQHEIGQAQEILDNCPDNLKHWEWHRLSLLADQSDLTIGEHSIPIMAVEFLHDPDVVMVINKAGLVNTYNRYTGKELRSLQLDIPIVARAAFCGQTRRLLTISRNGVPTLWNIDSGKAVSASLGRVDIQYVNRYPDTVHSNGSLAAFIEPDGLIAIADVRTPKLLTHLRAPSETKFVRCSSDGVRIVAVGHSTQWWNIKTGEKSQFSIDNNHGVSAIALSDNGQQLVVGYENGAASVYDLKTAKKIITLQGPERSARTVEFGVENRTIITAGQDGEIRFWDLDTGRVTLSLQGHTSTVRFLAYHSIFDELISFDVTNILKVWKPKRVAQTTTRVVDSYTSVSAFDPTGQFVAWIDSHSKIKLWNKRLPNDIQELDSHHEKVVALAFSSDGKRLVSGSEDQTIRIWNTSSKTQEALLHGFKGKILSLGIRTHPRRVIAVTTAAPNGIWVWEGESDVPQYSLEGRYPLAWSGNGNRVAFSPEPFVPGAPQGSFLVRDLDSGRIDREIKGQGSMILTLAFDENGGKIACSYQDKSIKVWDANTGQCLLERQLDQQQIRSMSFSPDGKRLATAGASIKLWDTLTGHDMYTVSDEKAGPFYSVSFGNNGKTLTSSGLNSITLWGSQ